MGTIQLLREDIGAKMTRVEELKQEIHKLHNEIHQIQEECSHPSLCVTKEPKSNDGHYDPSNDSYWYECHCGLCDKQWHEDQ